MPLFCTEKGQLRWCEHLIRMLLERLPLEVFWARSTGRRPWARPRTRWMDNISYLAQELLRVPLKELEMLLWIGVCEIPSLTCCPCDFTLDKWMKMERWMHVISD